MFCVCVYVWVILLCQQTHRSPNVMGIRWHLKAITIREDLRAKLDSKQAFQENQYTKKINRKPKGF